MITWSDLEKVRREIMREVENAFNRLLGNTLISSSSQLGDSDAVQKMDGALDPDGTKSQRPVVRAQPFGFSSRPPANLRTYWLRLGSTNVISIGIVPTQAYGPQDLNVGDSAVWSSNGSTVRCNADGSIHATDKGGASVVLDGSGNITATAAAPNGSIVLAATSTTGSVKLGGAAAALSPLAQGALDGMGMPVQQAPAIVSGGGPGLSIVKME